MQTLIPHERWALEPAYAPDVATDKMYVRFGGFLPSVDLFDAAAFRSFGLNLTVILHRRSTCAAAYRACWCCLCTCNCLEQAHGRLLMPSNGAGAAQVVAQRGGPHGSAVPRLAGADQPGAERHWRPGDLGDRRLCRRHAHGVHPAHHRCFLLHLLDDYLPLPLQVLQPSQAWLHCISKVCSDAGLGVKVTPNVSTGNGMDFLVGRLSYTFGLQARLSFLLSMTILTQACLAGCHAVLTNCSVLDIRRRFST